MVFLSVMPDCAAIDFHPNRQFVQFVSRRFKASPAISVCHEKGREITCARGLLQGGMFAPQAGGINNASQVIAPCRTHLGITCCVLLPFLLQFRSAVQFIQIITMSKINIAFGISSKYNFETARFQLCLKQVHQQIHRKVD